MKKLLTAWFVFVFLSSLSYTEPILTEDAKCLEKGSCELGLGVSYGVDAWKFDEANSPDYKMSLLKVGIPVKYGASEKFQLGAILPYRSWKFESDPDPYNVSESSAGIGQIAVNGKLGLSENFAVGLNVQLPTADVDKMLGEGTNIGLLLITTKDLEPLKISGNLGYLLKMKYEDEDKTEYDPGDPIIVSAAVEYPMKSISLIGEMQAQIFGKLKYTHEGGKETEWKDSNGTTIDMLVGSQYSKDALKLKLGIAFAVGDEDYRGGLFQFYESWDWKVILSCAYKL
ncbi:MAG: transporter [Elusimicrobiota bacterium]